MVSSDHQRDRSIQHPLETRDSTGRTRLERAPDKSNIGTAAAPDPVPASRLGGLLQDLAIDEWRWS